MERVKFDVCPSTLKVSFSTHEYDKRIRQLRNLLDEVYRNINTVTVIFVTTYDKMKYKDISINKLSHIEDEISKSR